MVKDTKTWAPQFEFDLELTNAKQFEALQDDYAEWYETLPPLTPLTLETGWVTITPQMAEELLRRNFPGANRYAVFSHIRFLAKTMLAGDWQPTGQSVIFDTSGCLIDGQHRLWACLLSGVTITTFVVTGVTHGKNVFAYIDNSKPRTAADALQTAGYNGVSPTIESILQIAVNVDAGVFFPATAKTVSKLQGAEALRHVVHYPNVQQAALLANNKYISAAKLIDSKPHIGYLAMQILDLHDQETCDEFFAQLTDLHGEYDGEGPIMGFRHLINVNEDMKRMKRCDETPTIPIMAKQHILGNLIIAFNHWVKGEKLPKRNPWMQIPSAFPSVESAQDAKIAAE